ncbi:MAG TPA: pyridoxal-dependent decarboxylase [Chloroflexota bacterium]|nr:pyridoxal-dependent decarboxylase [Chloroflexota bacterium]
MVSEEEARQLPGDVPPASAPRDMDPELFRRYGHQVIDWIASYMADPERYPVLAQVQPGAIRAQLPRQHPEQPEPIGQILEDFERVIVPGITHWNHPSFFAYFSISSSAPGILGELLSAVLNVNGMLWKTSPSATELEEHTMDWLRQMLGLPEGFHGVIMDTASIASMVAIAAAREALDLDIRQRGMLGRPELPRLRLYTSEEAHSSIEKGAMTLGLGQQSVRKIPTDAAFRLDVAALSQAIEQDIAAGWRPFFVAATVGTTSTTSIDPVPAIAALCREHGLWLHVDGAYGGMAAIVPAYRSVLDGCDQADSLVTNPHKWLLTPIDCSAFYVRDPAVLKRAFSLVPEFLTTGQDEVNNYMDWGVQLGRRFRALKLWMVIRYFGHDGLAAILQSHINLAQQFVAWVDADPDFERLAPTPLSTICFRAHPPGQDDEATLDRLNATLLARLNATGEVYLSHTRLRGRYTLRLAIGNVRTEERHVRHAWELLHRELQATLATDESASS